MITEHHTCEIAGTQIGVPICFTEYPQLSSLAAELWTPCWPLLQIKSRRKRQIQEDPYNSKGYTHTPLV